MVALRLHETENEAKRLLAGGKWTGPQEFVDYFRAGLGPPITRPGFLHLGKRAARVRIHPLVTTSPADVVTFIEHELEGSHDR